MTRLTLYIFTTFFLLLGNLSSGQTDTVVNGKKYNHVDYYSDGKIKSLGNLSDSLKTGDWTFYKPDGSILAKGKFVDGIAKGKWIYHDYDGNDRTYNWNWRKGFKPKTDLVIKEGKLYIQQGTLFSNGVFRQFENGKYLSGGKF